MGLILQTTHWPCSLSRSPAWAVTDFSISILASLHCSADSRCTMHWLLLELLLVVLYLPFVLMLTADTGDKRKRLPAGTWAGAGDARDFIH